MAPAEIPRAGIRFLREAHDLGKGNPAGRMALYGPVENPLIFR
jgi:hypothetical protein